MSTTSHTSSPTSAANPYVPSPWTLDPWIVFGVSHGHDEPCVIDKLDVHARVEGLFAEVTQTIVIFNPNARALSASLALPMPDGAVVCGYALDIDGQMVEGVVVSKEKARIAFEAEQRRGVDPGLVESVRGNVYRTRVYPVPGRGRRTVSLTYVAPLVWNPRKSDSTATLDLPMPPEHLADRSLRVEVMQADNPQPVVTGLGTVTMQEAGEWWVASYRDQDVTPSSHVRIATPELPDTFSIVERDADDKLWFFVTEPAPETKEEAPDSLTSLTVFWDASASRAEANHARELELLRGLDPEGTLEHIRLLTFAYEVHEAHDFDTLVEMADYLETLRYDGATNLRALADALNELPKDSDGPGQGSARLLFTDGIDTLADEGLEPLEGHDVLAVVSGSNRDTEAMRELCHGLVYTPESAPTTLPELAWTLSPTNPNRSVTLHCFGAGDALEVRLPGSGQRAALGRMYTETASVQLGDDLSAWELEAADADDGTLIARAWAAQRVARLSPRADEHAAELLKLGRSFGVVSPATSLIVLETLDQYLEHDIMPPASQPELLASWKHEHLQQRRTKMLSSRHHRQELVRAWGDLKEWWERTYEIPRPQDGRNPRFCPRCGTPTQPDWRFCANCGSFLEPISSTRRDYDFGELVEGGLPDAMPCSAPEPTLSGSDRLRRSVFYAEESVSTASAPIDASFAEAIRTDDATEQSQPRATVEVVPWRADADYLTMLDEALPNGREATHEAYFFQLDGNRHTPSFFLDCACWFFDLDDVAFGKSVLSNLAELDIDDAALLRVMGWRLREAGCLNEALTVFRRVKKLRSEDSQSTRDLALVLSELARESYAAGNMRDAYMYANEAAYRYRTLALTNWRRHPLSIALFAVEEYNVLRAWIDAQDWDDKPRMDALDRDLEGVLDCDLRITLAWDADETDVDLHVTEPSGEEAYYAHRKTLAGGRVSEDITDGYGPELYEIRRAQEGSYAIRAHYYASHQQSVFGPATCTLTIYTNWGRPTQTQQITSTRLDEARDMIPVGTAFYASSNQQ